MEIRVVHLDEESYKVQVRGMRLLTTLIWICEQDMYETVAMHHINALLHHERLLVGDLKDRIPFESSEEDMLWWLKQLGIVYDKKLTSKE